MHFNEWKLTLLIDFHKKNVQITTVLTMAIYQRFYALGYFINKTT